MMEFSENKLLSIVQQNPRELIKILNSTGATTHTLTFGAELLGNEVKEEDLVLPVLKKLIKHMNAVVREGAIMGIASFYYGKSLPTDIVVLLEEMKAHDPSPAIRDYCNGLIEEHLA